MSGVGLSLEPSCRISTTQFRLQHNFRCTTAFMSSCSTSSRSLSSSSKMRSKRHYQPVFHDVNLQVLVNLTMLLPHNRQQNLINVDPELKAYPVLLIKQARDMYLCISDIKTHICDILKETLSISIGPKEFRLTFDIYKSGELYRHHLSDDTSIYKTLLQCDLDYTTSWIRLTARPPIEW